MQVICGSKVPSSLIYSILRSIRMFLLINGGEIILSLIAKSFVRLPQVWFLNTASNSPLIGNHLPMCVVLFVFYEVPCHSLICVLKSIHDIRISDGIWFR